ncbi:hypothetical protein L1I30_02735 [Gillisia sp. M10.2A]|uniref:DUF4476 domain-containing protein n=1 Tax=Gillisia lutea TaxID=2909668 RepID=A0ABS9EFC6_9FLAO|nr:hypothetical protein [Gillisia lutea]MCF4100574.1 hypothetical protein [Gillisia lutea]
MKNKLNAELKKLANKILLDTEGNSLSSLKEQARELYEKLTVLAFTEENLAAFSTPASKVENKVERVEEKQKEVPVPIVAEAPKQEEVDMDEQAKQASQPVVEEKDEYLPDGTEYNETEITEPNTEKIKDIVAQMPPETEKVDAMVDTIFSRNGEMKFPENPSDYKKNDFRDIGVDYDNLPNFEPLKKQEKEKPKSLNDRLKKGINIGLNDRLAFIKHLFDGNTGDYNRVVSQLNTFHSLEEANKFIHLVVKPDYKNWMGKEEYEQRFMELVENKFDR